MWSQPVEDDHRKTRARPGGKKPEAAREGEATQRRRKRQVARERMKERVRLD